MQRIVARVSLAVSLLLIPAGVLANSNVHTHSKVCKNGTCTTKTYNKTCVKGKCKWNAHTHTSTK